VPTPLLRDTFIRAVQSVALDDNDQETANIPG